MNAGVVGRGAHGALCPESLDACLALMAESHDLMASSREAWRRRNRGYHQCLEREFKFLVAPGSSILEIGCATGSLLASLKPSLGVGIDVSPRMIEEARKLHPEPGLEFHAVSAERYDARGRRFDCIILSDVLPFLYDISDVFERLKPLCHPRTRIVISIYSNLWRPAIKAAELAGLKSPQPILNWVTREDVENLFQLNGYEVISACQAILLPFAIPLLGWPLNRILSWTPPFRSLCLANFVVARLPEPPFGKPPKVSVICPCRNESGNIEGVVRRLPRFDGGTELIFVEGHSHDSTYEMCLQAKAANPEMDIKVFRQEGKGKADAVRLGFSKAEGDVLIILDADMTVCPEDIPAFLKALMSGRAEFVNGSRLVYEMEGRAMRFLNLCANKFFALAFSFLIGQSVKDTLCGTKALTREDYLRIAAGRPYFGDFDPFGDFDLLFGAAKLKLKIHDLPVRYRSRSFGETQISRFRHGFMLLRMCAFALLKLKCH